MDFLDATIAALVAYLQTAIDNHASIATGAVTVIAGWPDFQAARDSDIAYVCVTAGDPTTSPTPSRQHSYAEGVTAYDVGSWDGAMQIDVFSRYKDTAQALSPVVRAALTDPPFDAGRTFTLSSYHNAKARVVADGRDVEWDADAVLTGLWRRTITLAAGGSVIATRSWPAYATSVVDINGRTVNVE